MESRIHIQNLNEFIENSALSVIGCPRGVEFSEFMVEKITYDCFFEDDFNCVILTNHEQVSNFYYKNIIKQLELFNFEDYKYNESTKEIKIGDSTILIVDISTQLFAVKENHLIDVLLIDNENGDSVYYEILNQQNIFKKVIIGTYDFSDSLYYKVADQFRIKIYSEKSELEYNNVLEKEFTLINEEKIYQGAFNQYD